MTTQKSWCQWTTHSTIMSICCWDLKQEITWTCDHVITWTWWIYIYSSLCGDSIFVSAALIGRINTGMVQDWSSFTKWCIKKKKKERKKKQSWQIEISRLNIFLRFFWGWGKFVHQQVQTSIHRSTASVFSVWGQSPACPVTTSQRRGTELDPASPVAPPALIQHLGNICTKSKKNTGKKLQIFVNPPNILLLSVQMR